MSKWKIKMAQLKSKIRRMRCDRIGHKWVRIGINFIAIPSMQKKRCSHCKIRNRPQGLMDCLNNGGF
jgi:hypothetical protein